MYSFLVHQTLLFSILGIASSYWFFHHNVKRGYGWRQVQGPWSGIESPDESYAFPHPLDPLTESEINMTSSIVKMYRNGNWIFNYISLKEPEKSTLLPYFLRNKNPPALSIPRKSFVVLIDSSYNQVHEVVVNLDTRKVETWEFATSEGEPLFTQEETLRSEAIIRENEDVAERCRRQGWTNMSLVTSDQWSVGYIGDIPGYKGKRIVQCYLYGRKFETDNHQAHPFDFLAVVDLGEGRVIALEDLPTHDDFDTSNKNGSSVPHTTANYASDLQHPSTFRQDLRPVTVSQQDGTSFTVSGHEIRWQNFKMRIGFNGREGLVIYNVNYNENRNVRPLFYRMSLPEMFVPYGDPRPPFHRKYGFDTGQRGFGFMSNHLQPQVDCLGQVHFFDGVTHNENGEAQKTPRAICLYEEDAGILWKHTDVRTGKTSMARSQRLALTFISTVGNYDYIFTWYFYQDAAIQFNVKLTGVVNTNLLAVNATPAGYGSIVFPQINAQYHQHFFTLRLDAEIDGNGNSVMVSDVVALSDSTGSMKNPYGQGFTTRNTLLKTTAKGRTMVSPKNSRTWHIQNPTSLHPYTKQPVAWKLIPSSSPPPLLRRDSPIYPKAEFLDFNTWVTPYQENQIFPGGFYLNNSGLPEWVGQSRNARIDNADIVIWHNFGTSHVPRVEDFPVMPVESCGVLLKPVNFFKENPAL